MAARANYRASIQFPNAHSDGIWSTFWTSNDKILTGSVDEVAKAWDVTKDAVSISQQYPGHVLDSCAQPFVGYSGKDH
ncbi:unnamed protein product [Peronospora belbahrii]|uniref:Uncharacterized protein n=1 Tax=Peronospora belbahrii TaxID=622444 RepID=A0ABN8D9F2_9STRA|nr:unnamed protein product [Peronospora belbahrii]